uniref:Uncharacterized protein n=1 Tax=Coccidioides posadasii RMSCC 3488 TaxID=454284 RepID=A0A0J6EU15_COCPO|nr:hypothetical protein CPAG_00383 [Coccidioides posadasii RMSCC 3488]
MDGRKSDRSTGWQVGQSESERLTQACQVRDCLGTTGRKDTHARHNYTLSIPPAMPWDRDPSVGAFCKTHPLETRWGFAQCADLSIDETIYAHYGVPSNGWPTLAFLFPVLKLKTSAVAGDGGLGINSASAVSRLQSYKNGHNSYHPQPRIWILRTE